MMLVTPYSYSQTVKSVELRLPLYRIEVGLHQEREPRNGRRHDATHDYTIVDASHRHVALPDRLFRGKGKWSATGEDSRLCIRRAQFKIIS